MPHRQFKAWIHATQVQQSVGTQALPVQGAYMCRQKATARTYALYRIDGARTKPYSQRQRRWAADQAVRFCCNFLLLFSFSNLGALVNLESLFNEKLIWRAKFLCCVKFGFYFASIVLLFPTNILYPLCRNLFISKEKHKVIIYLSVGDWDFSTYTCFLINFLGNYSSWVLTHVTRVNDAPIIPKLGKNGMNSELLRS